MYPSRTHRHWNTDKTGGGTKQSARSSWGQISNGRGWSEEITRLLGYYIIEIKCIFYYSFTLLSRMFPFSQHSHFVVHRSHCKWKKKAVSRNSQFNPSPWILTAWLGPAEKGGAVLGPWASYTPFPQEYMVLPWAALGSQGSILVSSLCSGLVGLTQQRYSAACFSKKASDAFYQHRYDCTWVQLSLMGQSLLKDIVASLETEPKLLCSSSSQ